MSEKSQDKRNIEKIAVELANYWAKHPEFNLGEILNKLFLEYQNQMPDFNTLLETSNEQLIEWLVKENGTFNMLKHTEENEKQVGRYLGLTTYGGKR